LVASPPARSGPPSPSGKDASAKSATYSPDQCTPRGDGDEVAQTDQNRDDHSEEAGHGAPPPAPEARVQALGSLNRSPDPGLSKGHRDRGGRGLVLKDP